MNAKSKKSRKGVAKAIFIIGVFYLINYCIGIFNIPKLEFDCRPKEKTAFDSVVWSKATYDSGIRYSMANDLLEKKYLNGMTKELVIELLGPPKWNELEMLSYEIAAQAKYPASSYFYPFLFFNTDSWLYKIQLSNGIVVKCTIKGS